MQSTGGGQSAGLSPRLVGSFGSSSSMRKRRMKMDRTCFCRLKTVIKKSSTLENPGRLFHTCPRYGKGSHCNYFSWVDDNEYDAFEVANGGAEAEFEVESDYEDWKVKLGWRMGSLEAEVRVVKMLFFFMFVLVIMLMLVVGAFCVKSVGK
ncbi:uncharacterized protein DS421_13g420590 [Arachis hypogaea]|uniref:GRF-type domain-containing protein n=1 Tax=Arachis hypogaea TaxID=3818 RepID=A0A444ZZ15_ARAHY|nr:uncharacterized protein DS421_13g420590 [Arachis hypogaea]RYR19396.1 hypothetical protein Ahy_B03g064162 [Arachis hypogaea]